MACGYSTAALTSTEPKEEVPTANQAVPSASKVSWVVALRAALNHGGTRRPKRWRREAKRKQLQLATVDPDTLAPSVRTVVFRGFLRADHLASAAAMSAPADGSDSEESLAGGPSPEGSRDSCIIILVTDSRSQKVRHARAGFPKASVEICWWLDEAAVQFRIAGRALVVDHSTTDSQLCAVRTAVWNRLRASTRETFIWPEPGQPRDDAVVPKPGELRLEDAHFAVFLVLPITVDELQLGGRQRRRIHKTAPLPEDQWQLPFSDLFEQILSQNWEVTDVNP